MDYPPRVARIPLLFRLIASLRARGVALAEMPFGLLRMNESMREMTNAVVSSTERLDHVERLVLRLDRLVGDLEEPLRSLAPGLTRLAKVLDDPTVDVLPETIHRLSQDALPLVKGMRETQARMAVIAASTDRISSIVDETGSRIAGLAGLVPGAGGLLRGFRSSAGQADTDAVLAESAPIDEVCLPAPDDDGHDDGRLPPPDLTAADETLSLRSSA